MIKPELLLAGALLEKPSSREVRNTLPLLAPEERATQLCNIEATDQVDAVHPGEVADTVRATGMSETTVTGNTIEAPGAAYRSNKRWYAMSYVCTVAADYRSVVDFRFRLGEPIPQSQWDSHDLNAVDDDE